MKRTTRIQIILTVLVGLLFMGSRAAAENNDTETLLSKELLSSSTSGGVTTFKWVVRYAPPIPSPSGPLSLVDTFSPNQSYVNGTEAHPDGWSVAQNPSGFTWQKDSPGYYNNVFPKYNGVIKVPGTGDGYRPIPYTALNGDKRVYFLNHHQIPGATLFNCVGACPTGSSWPRKLPDGDPNVNAYTGTTKGPETVILNRKLYYAVTRAGDSGLGCYDLEADTECGYLQLSNMGGAFAKKMEGPFKVGNSLITIDGAMKSYKVNITGNTMTPAGSFDMSTTGLPPQGNINVSGQVVGNNVYFVSDNKLACLDSASMSACAGWSGAQNANSSYAAASYLYYDTSMNPIGICVKSGINKCFDLNNGTPLSVADPFPANNQIGSGFTQGGKTFIPYVFTDKVYCYDWAAAAPCTPPMIVGPAGASTYAAEGDGNGCAWVYGDRSKLWSFDPLTGETPCGGKTMVLEDRYDASKNWCASQQVRWNYNSLVIQGIDPGDFSDLNITFYDADGNVITTESIPTSSPTFTENLAIAPFLPNAPIHYKIEGTWGPNADPSHPSPTVSIDLSAPPQEFCFDTQTRCPIGGKIKNSVEASIAQQSVATAQVIKEADGLCAQSAPTQEIGSCLQATPKLSCEDEGWIVTLEGIKPSSFGNDGKTSISVIAPDRVTLRPYQGKWYLAGARPGETVTLLVNSVLKGMGKFPGDDLCCATETNITIPESQSCTPKPETLHMDINKSYLPESKQFDIAVQVDGSIQPPKALLIRETLPEGITLRSLTAASAQNWTCSNTFPISGSAQIDCLYTGTMPVSGEQHLRFEADIEQEKMPRENCAELSVLAVNGLSLPFDGKRRDCATVPREDNASDIPTDEPPYNISSVKEFAGCDAAGICTFHLFLKNESNRTYNGPVYISEHPGNGQSNYPITSLTPAGLCPTQPATLPFQCVQHLSFAPNETKTFTLQIQVPAAAFGGGENCLSTFSPPASMSVGDYTDQEASQALQDANVIHPEHLSGNCVNFDLNKTDNNDTAPQGCQTDADCDDGTQAVRYCQVDTGLCLPKPQQPQQPEPPTPPAPKPDIPLPVPHPGSGLTGSPGTPDTSQGGIPAGAPRLQIVKMAPANCIAGNVCTYTIRVYNRGNALYNAPLRVVDRKSPGVGLYVGRSPSTWICNAAGNRVKCLLPHAVIAPGQYKELRLRFRTKRSRKKVYVKNCASIERLRSTPARTVTLQKRLKKMGYKGIRLNGKMDRATSRALYRYRKKLGLSERTAIRRLSGVVRPGIVRSCVKNVVKPRYETRPACHKGTHWDPRLKQCLPDLERPRCKPGTYWNSRIKRCLPKLIERPVCRKGTHFDRHLKRCVPDAIQRPRCPKGRYYNAKLKRCVPKVIEKPICKKGTHFDKRRRRCIPDQLIPPKCPKGTHYDRYRKRCIKNLLSQPRCKRGTIWDPRRKRCVIRRIDRQRPHTKPSPAGLTCPKGTYYNDRVHKCIPLRRR